MMNAQEVIVICNKLAESMMTTSTELEAYRKMYEELRAIIDCGSESMTHEDAVDALKRVFGAGR